MSALKYLKSLNNQLWDFKVAVNIIKSEFDCNNEQAFSKLNTLLKKEFSEDQISNWLKNWKDLIRNYEAPKSKAKDVQTVHNQFNIESVHKINNKTVIHNKRRKLHDISNGNTNQTQATGSNTLKQTTSTPTEEEGTEDQEEAENDDFLALPRLKPTEVDSSAFKEEIFKMATIAFRNGGLDLTEATYLQNLLNTFKPATLSDQLSYVAAKMLNNDLKDATNAVVLKSCVSSIINVVHPFAIKVVKNHLINERLWKSVSDDTIVMPVGLSQSSKTLFEDTIKYGCLKPSSSYQEIIEISYKSPYCKRLFAQKKIELLDNEASKEEHQLLDILFIMIINIANNAPVKGESEVTSYRHFAAIMDIVLRDSSVKLVDGEHVCKATREVLKNNKKYEEASKQSTQGFGRRIDAILSADDLELSAGEWKKEGAAVSVGLIQQTKNVRVNKILLKKLQSYVEEKADLYTLGLDFTGHQGYIFYVKQFEDAYIAKPVTGLRLPRTTAEIANCLNFIDNLFKVKNHNELLFELISPYVALKDQEEYMRSMIYFEEETTTNTSPNVLFTPPRKKSDARE